MCCANPHPGYLARGVVVVAKRLCQACPLEVYHPFGPPTSLSYQFKSSMQRPIRTLTASLTCRGTIPLAQVTTHPILLRTPSTTRTWTTSACLAQVTTPRERYLALLSVFLSGPHGFHAGRPRHSAGRRVPRWGTAHPPSPRSPIRISSSSHHASFVSSLASFESIGL